MNNLLKLNSDMIRDIKVYAHGKGMTYEQRLEFEDAERLNKYDDNNYRMIAYRKLNMLMDSFTQ